MNYPGDVLQVNLNPTDGPYSEDMSIAISFPLISNYKISSIYHFCVGVCACAMDVDMFDIISR